MEYLRVLNYGEAATSARLQRLLTVTPTRRTLSICWWAVTRSGTMGTRERRVIWTSGLQPANVNAERVATVLRQFGFSEPPVTRQPCSVSRIRLFGWVCRPSASTSSRARLVSNLPLLCAAKFANRWRRDKHYPSRRLKEKQKGQRQVEGLRRLGTLALKHSHDRKNPRCGSHSRQPPQLPSGQTRRDRQEAWARCRWHTRVEEGRQTTREAGAVGVRAEPLGLPGGQRPSPKESGQNCRSQGRRKGVVQRRARSGENQEAS